MVRPVLLLLKNKIKNKKEHGFLHKINLFHANIIQYQEKEKGQKKKKKIPSFTTLN
jgi:uncharacterized protein YihD (DUF1040 family)